MENTDPAATILGSLDALDASIQAKILADARSNIARGVGNWVDALVIAAEARRAIKASKE